MSTTDQSLPVLGNHSVPVRNAQMVMPVDSDQCRPRTSAMDLIHAFHCTAERCKVATCPAGKISLRCIELHRVACPRAATEYEADRRRHAVTLETCSGCRLWSVLHRTRLVSMLTLPPSNSCEVDASEEGRDGAAAPSEINDGERSQANKLEVDCQLASALDRRLDITLRSPRSAAWHSSLAQSGDLAPEPVNLLGTGGAALHGCILKASGCGARSGRQRLLLAQGSPGAASSHACGAICKTRRQQKYVMVSPPPPSIDPEAECVVCCDELGTQQLHWSCSTCRGTFHSGCWAKWAVQVPTCPLCRTSASFRRYN